MINRRTAMTATLATAFCGPLAARPINTRGHVVLGIALEPTGLDPTTMPAACIGEVVHYNIFETLTRIHADASVSPLLAERWQVSRDLRTTTLYLRKGVRFHNGAPFNAASAKFALERAGARGSQNKDRQHFASLHIRTESDHTLVLENERTDPDLLFRLGQATASMVEPISANSNVRRPIGTGPYRLAQWQPGEPLVLTRWPDYRGRAQARIDRATFQFIADVDAQAAALEAGDVDLFTGVAPQNAVRFKARQGYQVLEGETRAKTILAINHKRLALTDVRVRRAIAAAIDRRAVLAAAGADLGTPIGSHVVPGTFGYVDTTGINPFDPTLARSLLNEVGVRLPLSLTLSLPPTSYALLGGPVVATQLAAVGIHVQIKALDWPTWLRDTYASRNYDLTLISHVEPLDLGRFTEPNYYWQYSSKEFNALYRLIQSTAHPTEHASLLGEVQRLLASECAHAYLYQPRAVTVANHRLRGLQRNRPIPVNDLRTLYWT